MVSSRDKLLTSLSLKTPSNTPPLVVVVGWLLVQTLGVNGQVSLSLGTTPLANNSVVAITDIGDEATGGSPLICTTTFTPCCGTSPGRHGQWYYPDGRLVPASITDGDFYRNRRDDGTVRLHRRNYNALSPIGTYYCEIPLNSANDLQILTVRVTSAFGSVSITPSGNSTAGERYRLNCTAIVTDTSPTFTWFGPPNGNAVPSDGNALPSDTRTVSGVMSSGSTHTSILQFDPIQSSSHEGIYTCQIAAGPATEMRTIQVNVEEPVITAMVSASGIPIAAQSYSLTCTVTGADRLNPTITYQWFKNNTVVSGETQSTLSFSSLSLSDAGQYRCDVTISSTFVRQSIRPQSELELRIFNVVFQIRLNGISKCLDWVSRSNADTTARSGVIISTLVEAVTQACECGFTRELITEDAFQCFPESQQHVTFRARLTEISQTTTPQLITFIEQWVSTTQTITIQSVRLGINNTCDIVIEDFDSPECPIRHTTTPLTSTTPPPSNNNRVIFGAVIGVLLFLLISGFVVSIIVIIVVVKLKRKSTHTEKQNRAQMELPPVPAGPAPSYEDFTNGEDASSPSNALYGEIDSTEYNQCTAYGPTTTAKQAPQKVEPDNGEKQDKEMYENN